MVLVLLGCCYVSINGYGLVVQTNKELGGDKEEVIKSVAFVKSLVGVYKPGSILI